MPSYAGGGSSGSQTTTIINDTLWNAKGDIAVATANDTATVLAITSDGYTLTADAASTAGVKWANNRSRDQIKSAALGFYTQSFDYAPNSSATIPTTNAASGQLVLALAGFRAGDVVTNLYCAVTTLGTSVSFAKMGLYNSTGNFIRASASLSAQMNATANSYKTFPLTSTYSVTADGGYYIGFLQFGSGATGATLIRGQSNFNPQLGSNPFSAAQVTNQTDLSADITPATIAQAFWFGAS